MSASGSLGRSKNKHNQPRIQMKNPFLNFEGQKLFKTWFSYVVLGPGEPSDTHKMFMEEVNGQRAHNVWKKWLSDAPVNPTHRRSLTKTIMPRQDK
ncbi:unnamed protein product [Bursaphelenchus xylophilus]|uniref:(pine wood nematode) hypothetical protein n=1 Tax=Bursaphelenchus xylophilus TaxID=6326 RepID=A0A7I8XIA7_BURXY|nr:unnamed protein product [Bursaphelenchus xylophilus]CAG9085436.1 unnamed protein product [Bursaphelenchus xylophilus]